jgi:ribosomal protein S17
VRKYMRDTGVHQFFAWNPDIKASIAERFNRTIKQKVWKFLTYKNSYCYIDVLPDLVHSYNNSYHRSIKMTPTEASRPENERTVWQNLYGKRVRQKKSTRRRKPVKFKYHIGDYVRLSEERGVFRKGYKQRWTEEVFRVVKQSARDPVVYRLEDLSGEPLIGSFYEFELQKVSKPTTVKPKKTDKRERGLEHFVKNRGYPDYDNRWPTLTSQNKYRKKEEKE